MAGWGEVAGLSMKDIALILIGKYGSERTKGLLSQSLYGMAVIGVYKTLYPQFIQPLVSQLPFSPPSNPGHNPPPIPIQYYPPAEFR